MKPIDFIYKVMSTEFKDADGGHMSKPVVSSKLALIARKKQTIAGFMLYEISGAELFVHAIWVNKKLRRIGLARRMIRRFLQKYDKQTIWAYANPQGQALAKSCGFAVGTTEYREIILRS